MGVSFQLTFDANDPARLAEFWALALGYVMQPPPEGFADWDEWARAMGIPEENWDDARALVDPEEVGPRIFIQKVPEGKTAKNRLHLDINAGGPRDTPPDERKARVAETVRRLLAAGATEVGPMEQRDEYWVVMQDPEGNEFCIQ
jgi:hypothetical protein